MKFVLVLLGIALTVACWGSYGSVLHKGQHALDNDRLKPLICVGLAYLIVAIIVPVVYLTLEGTLTSGWTMKGISWSMFAGTAGALGALGIIIALTSGGNPIYVMALVFGCAPVINVFVSMYFQKIPMKDISPIFYAGMILVAVGAATVLLFQPRKQPPAHDDKPAAQEKVVDENGNEETA